MSLTKLALACLLTATALAAVPSASATCVTVAGTGVCATLGTSGSGPGVSGTGGLVCVDAYCPTLGSVPYHCVVELTGAGTLRMDVCVGTPVIT